MPRNTRGIGSDAAYDPIARRRGNYSGVDMIQDAITNPPIPDWNNLGNEARTALHKAWEFSSCPHACGGDPLHFYQELRRILIEREREILRLTMEGKMP
jgi:hypothetical protein